MKRLFAFLLVLMMVLEMFPAAAIHAHATEIEAPVTEETVPEETSAPTEETEPATEAAEPATEPTEPAVESTEPAAEETEPVEDSVDPQLSEVSTDATAAAQSELSATIEKQIRAFAKSIDQKNADDDAALELASHGMFGRGKKLSVGKNHALTAALMNSELAQVALTRFCEKAIRSMQQLDLEQMKHAHGNIQWGGTADSFYLLYVFSAADKSLNEREWSLIGTTHYAKNRNEYDESLDWMAGCTAVRMSFERSKVAANVATYQVTLDFRDRFDFATSGNSGFKDLISGIGALLFKEFDWSATVAFDLTVPYTCPHGTQMYRLTYDAKNKTMTADDSGSWQVNDTTHRIYTNNNKNSDYYELAKPVRLRHDAPWVMEYDIRNPNSFGFSPLPGANYSYPVLYNNQRVLLAVCDHKRVTLSQDIMNEYGLTNAYQSVRHYYGTSLNDRFTYSTQKTYTFRLENELHANGSNMIYLTVRETDTGTVVLDRTPMDDYYRYESWIKKRTLQDENNAWVSGKDLIFNYIGYTEYPFSASHFELRVWENGEDGDFVSDYRDEVTNPTCTKKGYTTHTCELCGYSYKDTYVNALGHSWNEGVVTKEPTEETAGIRTYTCATCAETKTEEIPVLEHTHHYEETVTAPTCTEQGYTTHTCACGDNYTDTYVEPLGHSYGEWMEATAPTCTESGLQRRDCANCDSYEVEELPAAGHSHAAVVTLPTCTEQGHTTHTCHCGDTYADTYTDPLGHNHLPVVADPTYTHRGYTEYICDRCGDSYVDENSYTDPLGLPVPVLNAENDPATGMPVITWEADGEADHYEIFRSASSKKDYKSIATTPEAAYTDETATAGKTYYYKVKAICAADGTLSGEQSTYKSAKCLYPQPAAEVSNSSSGSPIIKWAKIKGAKKYDVYYSTTVDGTYKKLTSTSSASYTHAKASSGKTYFYKVRAYGSSSSYAGAFSDIVCGVRKLAKPSITVTTNNDAGTAKITWKKITGAKSYALQCSINGGEFEKVEVINGTSYTYEGMKVGNSYAFRLQALCDNEDAFSDYSAEKTAFVKCAKPVLTATNDETGKPVLSWEAIDGAAEYEIQMATSSKGKYKQLAIVTDPNFVHADAARAKTYYYKVRAIDANGNAGALSSYKSATCKCEAPVITEVTTNSSGYPMIKWDKVTGAKKYEAWYATEEDGTYKKLTTTSSTSYTYSKAKMDTEYFFKVRAYGASTASMGEYSEIVCGIRKLAKPSITLTTSQTNKKITVKWKKVTNAKAYELQVSINGGEFATIANDTKLSYVHENLAPGNKYTYRVRAISADEKTSSDYCAEKSATIKVGKPSLTITLSESGKPELTWEAVEGAVEYQIYYATSKKGKYKLVQTTDELSYIYEAAKKGKTCYFKVRAVDINGITGDYSSVKSIKSK